MKQTLPTVTVGIPAYNESGNIGLLLADILNQQASGYVLERVIVASDGSDDSTVKIVRSFQDERVMAIHGRTRKGQALRQQQIFQQTESDIVVLLNADIRVFDPHMLSTLIDPILNDGAIGLTSGQTLPLSSKTWLGSLIDWSHVIKTQLYLRINQGDNVFLCHGRVRAFSKQLYKNIVWKPLRSEDAFSYFEAKKLGFSFAYSKDAIIHFMSPQTFSDHINQSVRFMFSSQELEQTFSKNIISEGYSIDKKLLLSWYFLTLLKHPLKTASYSLFVLTAALVTALGNVKHETHIWNSPLSTKKVS